MCDAVVTDSMAQRDAFGTQFTTHGEESYCKMVELGAVIAGKATGRCGADDITLFFSLGLAGTEVLVGADMLEWHRTRGGNSGS